MISIDFSATAHRPMIGRPPDRDGTTRSYALHCTSRRMKGHPPTAGPLLFSPCLVKTSSVPFSPLLFLLAANRQRVRKLPTYPHRSTPLLCRSCFLLLPLLSVQPVGQEPGRHPLMCLVNAIQVDLDLLGDAFPVIKTHRCEARGRGLSSATACVGHKSKLPQQVFFFIPSCQKIETKPEGCYRALKYKQIRSLFDRVKAPLVC